MGSEFKKIGVVGAGAMGSQLAALFAGCGIDVELVDIGPRAAESIVRIRRVRSPALISEEDAGRIRPGNVGVHISRLRDCDWVIEAVDERLDVKRRVFSELDGLLRDDAVVSSNTSSITRQALAQGLSRRFRRRFLITHFFNPPHHMKLVEIVAGGEVDSRAIDAVEAFAKQRLGRLIVHVKDTPAFIANRIGIFHFFDVMRMVEENGWPIEAADAVLGKAAARPAGLFRVADMVGLDIVRAIARNIIGGCADGDGAKQIRIPEFFERMLGKGLMGDKAGRGFYFRDKSKEKVFAFDPSRMDYRPRIWFNAASFSEAGGIASASERLKRVVFARDPAGEIAWPAISRVITYAANRIPEISDDCASVDRAMRWGYGWGLGPFETWDALGVADVAERLSQEGTPVPKLVVDLLEGGKKSFYESMSASLPTLV